MPGSGSHGLGAIRFAHPAGFDEDLSAADVAVMVQRALNCVDARLVDHGLRVAALLDAMLEVDGSLDEDVRRVARLVAALHDVGAYRTEEIDRLVSFETEGVWEHSFYGYLFLRELSPLSDYAEVVLFHHMPFDRLVEQDPQLRLLASALHVADRADVVRLERPQADAAEVVRQLAKARPGQFSPHAVALLEEAARRSDVLEEAPRMAQPDVRRIVGDRIFAHAPSSYLDLLVHIIDFRSRHTVTHTVTTAWVAYELAVRLLEDERAAARVYASALVHDVGKIGIPLSILEKPGRLDEKETAVMRTHVALTEGILAGCIDEGLLQTAVRHHEKLDGSGYPRGLGADQLSVPDRIVAVADIVSALVGTRSYKRAYPKEKVLELLSEQAAAGKIDPHVVRTMERDYDAIMASVEQACLPVATAYDRVQEGFAWLVRQLEETRIANEGRSA